MAHIMILSCRPYFESPRGRWAFRLMCEAILLYVFHAVQLMRSGCEATLLAVHARS